MSSKVLDLEYLLPPEVPRVVARLLSKGLEGPLGFTKLNELHERIVTYCQNESGENRAGTAASFALKDLGVDLKITGSFSEIPAGPVVVVANHPFGGVEAVALVKLLSDLPLEARILANSMLKIFPVFSAALIYVDPFGDRDSSVRNLKPMKLARAHLSAGGVLGVFPAGSVATFQWGEFRPTEDPWNPAIAKLILGARATVVPVYFHGRNSPLFQAVSLLSRTARLAIIVRELVENSPPELPVVIGKPISVDEYSEIRGADELIRWFRERCLALESALHAN